MNRFLSFLFCLLAVATCKTHQTAESITLGTKSSCARLSSFP